MDYDYKDSGLKLEDVLVSFYILYFNIVKRYIYKGVPHQTLHFEQLQSVYMGNIWKKMAHSSREINNWNVTNINARQWPRPLGQTVHTAPQADHYHSAPWPIMTDLEGSEWGKGPSSAPINSVEQRLDVTMATFTCGCNKTFHHSRKRQ